jgi:lipopolysaccharide assembly outer membrane protein LptD (OstA)
VPSPSASATPGCEQHVTIGEATLCTNALNVNLKSGDFQLPQAFHGRTNDGNYRADRGYGNLHSQIMNLIGHVVMHRDATKDKSGKPVEALNLTADLVHIESKAKFYRASGNVKVVQGQITMTAPLVVDSDAQHTITASGGVTIVKGDKTLTAPQIVLNQVTHVATLTGGVHAEQKPDRSFDAAEVIYNTATEDFKAVGGVKMLFPASAVTPVPAASSSPTPAAGPSASARPAASPTPHASP